MLRKTLEGQAKADTVSTKTLLIRHVGVKRLGYCGESFVDWA